MSLPVSGEISYNEISIEVGNSSGSEADMDVMTALVPIACSIKILPTPDYISDWFNIGGSMPSWIKNAVGHNVSIDYIAGCGRRYIISFNLYLLDILTTLDKM